MPRLLIHVEGQTEETFVNEVLRNYLVAAGYDSVGARIVGNARARDRRGGIRPWESVKKDILQHLKEDKNCIATTMVDFYGLGDWPKRAEAGKVASLEAKAAMVEAAMLQGVASGIDGTRFVPFVVMHEFEGLLFSDCAAFGRGIYKPELAASFQQIRDQFETPEHINDSPQTAPSKRIISLLPGYQKPLLGNLAALEIGLERIRAECPRFQRWLEQLSALAA